MRRILKLSTLALLTSSALLTVAPQQSYAQLFSNNKATETNSIHTTPESFADLAEKLLPAVVNISSTQKVEQVANEMPHMPQFPPGSPFEDFFEEFLNRRDGQNIPKVPAASLGSGFVIDSENGYIITNNHVIRDAEEVRVTLHDDTTLTAEIVGMDEKTDIAVLKVDTKEHKLTSVNFGDSDILRVGDWILAIGNPFGLGGTVTAGIVSARQRNINSGPYDDFIQTDASINRGNSGGPMFDTNGTVIGINTAIFSPSGGSVGIGFAIPSALAEPVIQQIIEYGRTRRGWLGVKIQSVTDEIAESLGLSSAKGALVASISPDGPAEAAGLQAGDVITSFNGQDIDEMRKLPRIVAETPINTEVPVEIWRNKKMLTKKVAIGELEKAEDEGLIKLTDKDSSTASKDTEIKGLGFSVTEMNNLLREQFSIPDDVQGVVITQVDDLSEAAEQGLFPGDVLIEANQKKIDNIKSLQEIITQAQTEKKTSILFLLNREGNVRFTALKLTAQPPK